MASMYDPPHPGAVLEDYLPEKKVMPKGAFAEHIGMTRQWLDKLLKGERPLTVDDAVRLSMVFDMSAEAWLTLQVQWDLWKASQQPLPDVKPIPHAA